MQDGERRRTGGLMLISPERVLYAGLLGRPRQRTSGGFNIYVALQGQLRFEIGRRVFADEMAMVAPYTAHSVQSDHPSIVCLVIEPETVDPLAMADLNGRLTDDGGAAFVARVRTAYRDLSAQRPRAGFTTESFDRLVFGEALLRRRIDPRIARSVALLNDVREHVTTAAECAAATGLSQSRFLHLFKDETGVSFRALRAWKRARHLLHFANQELNLAHLAQEIGYPDSTHFSHSIRRFYGLKPKAIFVGSRDLAIQRSDPAPDRFRGRLEPVSGQ